MRTRGNYRPKYLIFCVKRSKLLKEVINRKLKRWERTVTWLFLISMHGSGDKCLHYPLFWSSFLFDCPGKLLVKHWQLMEVQRTSNLIFCLRNKNKKPFKNVINITSFLDRSVMFCLVIANQTLKKAAVKYSQKNPQLVITFRDKRVHFLCNSGVCRHNYMLHHHFQILVSLNQ